ncbi:MAG: glycosyltransferase family 4 protein [Anaerolineales bacterium]|nr:glycosyltransferase family 4 protein [Anaerolineales bacterium]
MSDLRVGIYNRWLATLGGGEKYSLSIAEHLSQRHQVEVLSPAATSKALAAERLNLDLSRVAFTQLKECTPEEMASLTADYDLFINSSFMDFFPCLARASANAVYFPARIDLGVSLRRSLKLAARRFFRMPAFRTGVIRASGPAADFRWLTGQRVSIDLPPDPDGYTFSFSVILKVKKTSRLIAILNGQEMLLTESLSADRFTTFSIAIPGGSMHAPHRLVLQAGAQELPGDQPIMEITSVAMSLPRYRMYQRLFTGSLQRLGRMLHYHPLPPAVILKYLDTYSAIWAISAFSQRWIQRYWRRNSAVLYPPIRNEDFRVGEKQPQILSVGRFFAGQHNKKHLEMVNAFKSMVDNGLSGWELHLAGGTTPGEEHEAHLRNIQLATQGYPVHLRLDIPFAELLQLYADSAIYWHASGYGEDERREPVRFEHFGITTVEAMAAGCVPVVIGKGAQPEIVVHGSNGFLWQTMEELQGFTTRLIQDPMLRKHISRAARQASQRYDRQHFDTRLDELLAQIGFPG